MSFVYKQVHSEVPALSPQTKGPSSHCPCDRKAADEHHSSTTRKGGLSCSKSAPFSDKCRGIGPLLALVVAAAPGLERVPVLVRRCARPELQFSNTSSCVDLGSRGGSGQASLHVALNTRRGNVGQHGVF